MDARTREGRPLGPWKPPCTDAAFPTWVWDPAIGDNLHQQDPKGPDIRLDGEGAKVNGFRSCPLDGELGPCRLDRAESGRAWGAVRAEALLGGVDRTGHSCTQLPPAELRFPSNLVSAETRNIHDEADV